MSRIFSIQPEAKDDIVSAARSLQMSNVRAAERFIDLVEKYLGLIEKNPLVFGILFDNVRAVTMSEP